MPRPKVNPEQRAAARDLFYIGNSAAEIREDLEDTFDSPASLRTVATWFSEFKLEEERLKLLDAPFEWHRMDEYGLLWESSDFILEMWSNVKEGRLKLTADNNPIFVTFEATGPITRRLQTLLQHPTARQVIWWSRVHLAAPQIGMFDLWHLAQRLVRTELVAISQKIPADLTPFEAHLAYKPWEAYKPWLNKDKGAMYWRAIEDERIPPLPSRKEHDGLLALPYELILGYGDNILTTLAGHPEMLPSQAIRCLENKKI